MNKTSNTFEIVNALYDGLELTNAFKSRMFPLYSTQGKGRPHMLASRSSDLAPITHVAKFSDRRVSDHTRLEVLTSKQMLQRLPIVKTGNASENLLNEIRQIIYSFYWANKITKKVYNNIMNSLKL